MATPGLPAPATDAKGRLLRISPGFIEWLGNPPFLAGAGGRIHAAAFSFWAGGIAPAPRCSATVCLQTMKGMFGRSLLQAHGHCVAKSWASRWPAGDCLQSSRGSLVSMVR
jgi:hypothetical protein